MPRTLASALLAGLLAGATTCASAQASAQSAPADAQSIPIYESVTSATRRFEIIKRLWTES